MLIFLNGETYEFSGEELKAKIVVGPDGKSVGLEGFGTKVMKEGERVSSVHIHFTRDEAIEACRILLDSFDVRDQVLGTPGQMNS